MTRTSSNELKENENDNVDPMGLDSDSHEQHSNSRLPYGIKARNGVGNKTLKN